MKINIEQLYFLYMQEVIEIAEKCDWVTDIKPKEIVSIIARIIEENPSIIINKNEY